MTLERGLELLAGRRAWEAENGPSPKKSRKKAAAKPKKGDTAPTLTKNVVKKAGAKKAAKKAATGKAKKKADQGFFLYPFGHAGLSPVTFLIVFPLIQMIVIFLPTAVFCAVFAAALASTSCLALSDAAFSIFSC